MLRYLRRLADRDIALDRAMIPLGSCTMKLNATSEMIPVTWPEFGELHPFAPADQAEGYRELVAELERMLCAATGYAAVSLQPNAGSQGEYAGLLVIQAYHASRGEGHRDVCLIPASAHGTNPASAHMAGMRVVVVACDDDGNVDIADLEAQGARARARSSRRSWSRTRRRTACSRTASGASAKSCTRTAGRSTSTARTSMRWSALRRPGEFGADVSHLNLHKTFCIPHGGGGPGVGPIGVGAHLARFLPGHRYLPRRARRDRRRLGRALRLRVDPADLVDVHRDDGRRGARRPRRRARSSPRTTSRGGSLAHYPVLYSGPGGLVAHECILDLRPLKETSDIAVDDVAKRLIDYGFHAPTMSFPVAGTLMIEPTESESKAELDRFIDAMIAIRGEIRADRGGPRRPRRQCAQERAAHGGRGERGRLAPRISPRGGRLSDGVAARGEILAAGRARRQRLRGSQPVLQLHPACRLRREARRGAPPPAGAG